MRKVVPVALAAMLLLLAACNGRPAEEGTPPGGSAPIVNPAPQPGAKSAPLQAVTVTVPAKYKGAYPGGTHTLMAPPGFAVSVYAAGLKGPRHMAQGPDGAIYIAEKDANRVSRLPDSDGDGVADSVETYVTGMDVAHSVQWHDGSLYVGATDGIYRFAPPVKAGDKGQKIIDLPARGGHSTRTVHFGPDGKLYVTVGSSCNICVEQDAHRAAMWVYDANGKGGRLFATGLRNTVDFAFHPATGAIYGVDNGRDALGDDQPPEELNLIADGGDYGWPVCHGGDIIDPKFGKAGSCKGTQPPALKLQAHSAPLGVQFYTTGQFPAPYQGRLFITFHGSWNRSEKTGYKVLSVPFHDGKPAGPAEDFLTGWLSGSSAWGRPVGVLQTRDGALLISDDQGGVIYRVTYRSDGR